MVFGVVYENEIGIPIGLVLKKVQDRGGVGLGDAEVHALQDEHFRFGQVDKEDVKGRAGKYVDDAMGGKAVTFTYRTLARMDRHNS